MRMPAKSRIFKKAARAAKTGETLLKKTGDSLVKADKIRETIANEPVPAILNVMTKIAMLKKSPIGAMGLNLMPETTRDVAISGAATGDVTTSASGYMFRPPRKRVPDAVQYCMKRVATAGAINSVAGAATVFDCNLLDAEPVQGNPNDNNDYSRLTIRKAFDNMLLGKTGIGTTDYTMKVQQSSIHVKSFTNEFTVKNNLNTECLFDIYELVPQHVLTNTTYFNNPPSDRYAEGYMSPTWTYNQGLDGTTDVIEIGSDLSSTNVAANPFVSTVFSRTWKVVKHVRVNMTGNSVHRHKSVYSINKTVSYQELAQITTQGGKFAGWNPTLMCIQRGAPTSTSVAADTSISYTSNMQLNYEATPDRQSKVIVFDANT